MSGSCSHWSVSIFCYLVSWKIGHITYNNFKFEKYMCTLVHKNKFMIPIQIPIHNFVTYWCKKWFKRIIIYTLHKILFTYTVFMSCIWFVILVTCKYDKWFTMIIIDDDIPFLSPSLLSSLMLCTAWPISMMYVKRTM